jgi:hypothetical protein
MEIIIKGYIEYMSHANDFMIEWISIQNEREEDQTDTIRWLIGYDKRKSTVTIKIED